MAENYTLKIDAGADKILRLRFKDSNGNYENLTSYSARMMFKQKYDSALPIISLTSEVSGGITFEKWDDTTSAYLDTMVIHLTDVQTDTLVDYTVLDSDGDVELGTGVYDLEIIDELGLVNRAIQGYWIAFPAVTRE